MNVEMVKKWLIEVDGDSGMDIEMAVELIDCPVNGLNVFCESEKAGISHNFQW